ncbi:MAG: ParB/RepB/Spo0J family partition protein [Anaerolineales bacterium]|nr:ParB/RepB/Spo0J family partition protein [Anaerolineales bacterium]
MPPKRGLGRGLDALIPVSEAQGGVSQLPITSITRNPRQPRTRFEPAALEELAASIREHGILQPLVVAQTGAPGRYVLIAGERRLEASKLAGLPTVPALIREATDQQLLELALIENIQRADLGPLETALAYKHLADDFKLSHEEIAARVGKKRVTVTNTLRLLKLPQRLLDSLANDQITEGHARALLALPNTQAQLAAFNTVIGKGLTVRQTEELVRRLLGQKDAKPAKPARNSADADALTERLRVKLGTKVALNRGRKGGTVVIHFYSDEELNAITAALLGE